MPTSLHKVPDDIKLTNPPLTEAWLELRWALRPINPPQIMKDPHFDESWVNLYSRVMERFPRRESINSDVPDQMLPHQIRYRFRPEEVNWPVLQIGPGVATVNHVDGYEWSVFLRDALYLRNHLIKAYGSGNLKFTDIFLRYRNIEPFDPFANDVRDFLREKLHIYLEMPTPNVGTSNPYPYPVEIKSEFQLDNLKGAASIHVAIAERRNEKQKTKDHVVLWELTVASRGSSVPQIKNAGKFTDWLNAAHDVVHEWFFALIDGQLRQKYE